MVRARGAGAPSAAGVVVTLGPAALRAGPRGLVCGPWAGQRAASAGRENGQSRGQRKPRRLRAAGLPDPCAKGRTCAGSAAVGRPPWHSVSPRGGIKDSSSWAAQGSEVTGQPPAWLEGGISGSHTHTLSLSCFHLPRNIPYERDIRQSPALPKGKCILGSSKPQSFPGPKPTCLAVLSCESAAFSGSQHRREQTDLGMVIGQKLQANS